MDVLLSITSTNIEKVKARPDAKGLAGFIQDSNPDSKPASIVGKGQRGPDLQIWSLDDKGN